MDQQQWAQLLQDSQYAQYLAYAGLAPASAFTNPYAPRFDHTQDLQVQLEMEHRMMESSYLQSLEAGLETSQKWVLEQEAELAGRPTFEQQILASQQEILAASQPIVRARESRYSSDEQAAASSAAYLHFQEVMQAARQALAENATSFTARTKQDAYDSESTSNLSTRMIDLSGDETINADLL